MPIKMTVKPEKKSESREVLVSEFQKPEFSFSQELDMDAEELAGKKVGDDRIFSVLKSKLCAAEAEMDQESGGSSEEMESPKSVGRWRRKKDFVHSQILRIREEDLHLRENIGERSLGAKDKAANRVTTTSFGLVLFSRPILPCSPLGGKTAVKDLH